MKNKLSVVAVAFYAAMFGSATAYGETYPSRAVRVVVPYTPGGSTDVLARIVTEKLSQKFGQTFVVENRPGASGHIGAERVAKSDPDGYTLGVGAIPIHSAYKIYPTLNYDPTTDIIPISIIGEFPSLLIANNEFKANNVSELLALSKKEIVHYGSAGLGSATHLGAALFAQKAHANMDHVPYRGSSAASTDLMGGQIQLMFENLPTAVSLVDSGRVKALAVTSKERAPSLPDIPTVAESGVPDYSFSAWYSFFVPKGTPTDIQNKLSQALDEVLHSDELKDKFSTMGMQPVGGTVEHGLKYVSKQTALWTEIIETNNLQAK